MGHSILNPSSTSNFEETAGTPPPVAPYSRNRDSKTSRSLPLDQTYAGSFSCNGHLDGLGSDGGFQMSDVECGSCSPHKKLTIFSVNMFARCTLLSQF